MRNQTLCSLLSDKLDVFYILAFLPLPLIGYYRYAFFSNPQGVLIPLYGFLLLLMKKEKLSEHATETKVFQRFLGVSIVFLSFFLYYAIVPFLPWTGFYGVANYTVYLFGILLIFFKMSVLKHTFAVFFLIVAGALAGLSFRWIESLMAPTVPYYVNLFSSVLNLFGVENTMPHSTAILMYTPRGVMPLLFEAGCIGVYSLIIFSIIIVVTMLETPVGRSTKLLWSLMGLIGVFVVNIIRLLIVVVSMYFYGWDFGQSVHQVIGYILFLSWVAIFLFLFTKRQAIFRKIQLVRRKLTAWL